MQLIDSSPDTFTDQGSSWILFVYIDLYIILSFYRRGAAIFYPLVRRVAEEHMKLNLEDTI